jgi:heptose I phosphotransferase
LADDPRISDGPGPLPGFSTVASASGRVHANPACAEAIEKLGLERFAEAMRFVGGETVDRNRKRSVVKISCGGKDYFLKRFTKPPAKDTLFQWLRGRRARTHARLEWEAIRALEAAGIGAPEVAAVGEASGGGLRKPSFLLTVGLEDRVALDAFLERGDYDALDRSGKRAFVRALAQTVRRMHDAGITHPDLYAWHVFVRREEGGWSFALIDLHRAVVKGRVSLFDAVRDLTGLHLTAHPASIGRPDRVRFLRAYFGGGRLRPAGKRLGRKILARAKRIASRKRFRSV